MITYTLPYLYGTNPFNITNTSSKYMSDRANLRFFQIKKSRITPITMKQTMVALAYSDPSFSLKAGTLAYPVRIVAEIPGIFVHSFV